MKARVIYLFCFLGLSSQISFGSDTGSQLPPRTKDYPAPPVYKGKPAKLSLDSELARTFRTRLTAALSQKPVYAGEYVLTGWDVVHQVVMIKSLSTNARARYWMRYLMPIAHMM